MKYQNFGFHLLTVLSLICCYHCTVVASDSETYRTTTESTTDKADSLTSTLIDWLFRAYTNSFDNDRTRETASEKMTVPHMNPMRMSIGNSSGSGRQILLSPAEVILIQRQQQQQQAIAAAQLQQQIIRNRYNQFGNDDDDSSEEDEDFESNDFWDAPPAPLRRRIIPGVGFGFRSGLDDETTEASKPEFRAGASEETCTCPPSTSTEGMSTTDYTTDTTDGTTSVDTTTTSSNNSTESVSTSTETTSTTVAPKKPPYKNNLDCRCGTQTTKDISLGTITLQTNIYPWIVSINSKNSHLCTGSIINSKFILTSATCVIGFAAEDLVIKGTLTSPNVTTYHVEKLHYHPATKNNSMENNIALIEIKEIFRPSKSLKFICLPIGHKMAGEAGITVTLAKVQNSPKLTLIQENVQEIQSGRCRTLMKKQKAKLPQNSFCTAPPRKECHGDTGGSFITHGKGYSFVIKGLISSNAGCKRRAQPTIHTMVGRYTNWILFKTQKASYCKEPDFTTELRNLPE